MVSIFNPKQVELCLHKSSLVITETKSYTASEVSDLANEISREVPPRSLVIMVATNSIETLAAYVGFLNKTAIPLFTASTIAESALDDLIVEYQAEYVWCPTGFSCIGKEVYRFLDYVLYATGCTSESKPYADLALLLPTSGSTGSNKYVRLSYRNIESNAEAIVSYLDIKKTDRAITTLPFSYTYCQSIINSHLLAGASLILTERTLFDRDFWNLFKKAEATTFGGVPYTYAMLKNLRFARMPLPSLRYLTQAGGRLGEELHQEFAEVCKDKGIDFVVMYGQTEGTARLSYLPAECTLEKVGYIGIPIPGGSFELIDDEGEIINEPRVSGELVYRGENVSLGYATCRKDLEKGDERQGVLYTGDIAVFDEEGYYRVVGRKSRFLKVFGNRINLDEIDAILSAAGFEAVSFGADDNLVIYLASGGSEKDVRGALCDRTSLNSNAFSVKHIRNIPRNEAGKVMYTELENAC